MTRAAAQPATTRRASSITRFLRKRFAFLLWPVDRLHTVVQNALNTGRDPHVVVSDSSGGRFTPTISRLGMRSIKKLKVDGHGFETFELENGQ
jgi:hypothetical protein